MPESWILSDVPPLGDSCLLLRFFWPENFSLPCACSRRFLKQITKSNINDFLLLIIDRLSERTTHRFLAHFKKCLKVSENEFMHATLI